MGEKIGELVVKKYFEKGALDDQMKICQFIDGVIGVCQKYIPSLDISLKKPKRIADEAVTQEGSSKKQKLDLPLVKDLPNEIWFKIFSLLPSKFVLGTISRVSKRFFSIAHQVVEHLIINNLDAQAIVYVSKSLGSLTFLRELTITNCPDSTKLVPIALESNPGLKTLAVDFYQKEIATFGKNLDYLEVKF